MRDWFIACLLALGVIGDAAADPAARVSAVRFVELADMTQVVIETDKPLKYDIFSLAAGADRIVIDFPRVRWSLEGLTAESGAGDGEGLVARFRYAHSAAATSRLVLDLAGPALVAKDRLLPSASASGGPQIVLDLKKTTAQNFAKAASADHGGVKIESRKPVRKPLIVIDPGHGGKDPGASAPDGVREKDVTLEIALALKAELLQSERYAVALTRSTDAFIELEDRVARARALGADLFIALHADAGADPNVRGASVYTLSPEGEKRAESERHRNDWVLAVETDRSRSHEVNQILADLVTRETKNQSARFAQALVPALTEAGWPALQNAHRRRGFYVLLSPDVPAVLLEMGFITNIADEDMLTSETRRRRLVGGIRAAIDGFFDAENRGRPIK